MSVRYKFKSEKNFSQILFDGIHISVADVKDEIFKQRRLGRSEDVDLMILNAETGKEFSDEESLIPKNSTLTVMRVPATKNQFNKRKVSPKVAPVVAKDVNQKKSFVNSDLLSMKASEEEKIFTMMMQSTLEYQSFYKTPQTQLSTPPSTYVCRKCHVPGHWIRNCPFNVSQKTIRYDPIKPRRESNKMTGIPMSMRNKVESRQFYGSDMKSFQVPHVNIHCEICKDIFRNPVTMPCCKSIYCNECAIMKLVESDESTCPKCNANFIQLGMLDDNLEMKKTIENSLSSKPVLMRC